MVGKHAAQIIARPADIGLAAIENGLGPRSRRQTLASAGRVRAREIGIDPRRFAAVAAYTIGMALFTIVMGNAFAAFPVMTAAIGLPLIVDRFGGDPAVMGAIGMLSGFCGTLMTPMAANFNIVPAALLELKDRNAVIKVQIPTGLWLLAGNTVLMYALVFRR